MSNEYEIRAAARMQGELQNAVAKMRADVSLEEPGLAAFLMLASMGTDMADDFDADVMQRGARLLDEGALRAAFDATGPMLNLLQMQREIIIAEIGRRKGAKENH